MSDLSRRGALGLGLAAALAGPSSAAGKAPFFKRTGLPIGIQLYTLGGDLRADLDGQLGQLAKIGYRTVEMAGYLGRTPKELRAAFDKAGLACPSSHVQGRSRGPEPSLADLDRLIADAQVIGIKHIVLPSYVAPEGATDADKATPAYWQTTVDLLNKTAVTLKAAGLTMGYHNHNAEFAPIGATNAMEILLKGTDPALVQFEMDIGWAVAGGADPVSYLTKYPERYHSLHIKDLKNVGIPNNNMKMISAIIGKGIIDWKTVLAAAQKARIERAFLEIEEPYDPSPLEMVKQSFDYLHGKV
jgi:sugar phosphate isomerase/epimerase